MIERQKRLKEVYDHLRAHFGVHTQKDFADSVKYSRVYISAAMNGADRYLTDKLFTNICEAYPGVFNLDYLLTGKGQLITVEEEVKSSEIEKATSHALAQPVAPIPDYSSLINAALAAKDETIVSLKRELQTKDDLIHSLRDQLSAKDQLIAEQKARLIDYHKIIDSNNSLSDYPFPIGAADKPNPIKNRKNV